MGGLFLLCSTLLVGCAASLNLTAIRTHAHLLPEKIELSAVPFFPQEEFQCGPAALATTLSWSGIKTDADTLVPMMYLPAKQGSLQAELIATSRRHGRIAYQLRPSFEALLSEVAAGHPVLVLQNLGLSWYPVWHYAVVVGFDLQREEVILRSGTIERRIIPMRVFYNTWNRSGLWSIVVLSPKSMPETVEREPYLKAIAALELTRQWESMRDAYQQALARWPGTLVALIGLGNSVYQMGDLSAAEAAFRQAAANHPTSAVALNNLAQVLADQGRLAEAVDFAQAAVKLGGPFRANAEQTLAEIRARHN